MIINTEGIKALLDSDVSAYKIEKETGVSRATISDYRTSKSNWRNMSLEKATQLQKYINKKGEIKMIKWTGKNTSRRTTWEVEAETFEELYNELVKRDIISELTDEINMFTPYQEMILEINGLDRYEILEDKNYEEAVETIGELIENGKRPTNDDWQDMISNQDGNAYYQTFEVE